MERKTSKKENKTQPVEVILNVDQACNEFHLTGTTRAHVLKKFKGSVNTLSNWTHIFKEQRIT